MRKKDSIGQWILIILMWVLIFAVGYGMILAEYGDKPINEVPVWVLWMLRGK